MKKSTTAFVALLEAMHKRQKAAICVLTARANAAPRLCALLPQMETFNEVGEQDLPAGFAVVQLPFADDVRALDVPSVPKPSAEVLAAAKRLVVAAKHSDEFLYEDPAPQTHYANLHALALGADEPEKVEDTIQPDLKKLKDEVFDAVICCFFLFLSI